MKCLRGLPEFVVGRGFSPSQFAIDGLKPIVRPAKSVSTLCLARKAADRNRPGTGFLGIAMTVDAGHRGAGRGFARARVRVVSTLGIPGWVADLGVADLPGIFFDRLAKRLADLLFGTIDQRFQVKGR
jgi:hypothetical protein